jgi:hypothetical protein
MPHQSHNSPIILFIHEAQRCPNKVAEIISKAQRKVGHPNKNALELVAYRAQLTKAMILMTIPSEVGLRRRFVLALRDIEGVESAS